jgi:hypothetical protein
VQAQYWHDPLHTDKYVEKSRFIAEINNEKPEKNASYAVNLALLENFVMILHESDSMVEPRHGRINYKDTKPYMSAFLSVDLLTELCGILFNRFYRLEIHSQMVCILDPACELLPPWKKELYFTCVLLPLYCTFPLTSFPLPPSQMYSIYRQLARSLKVFLEGSGVLNR